MGVDRTDYLMFGVDLGGGAFDWDKHVNEIEGNSNARFDLINDDMSGQYCIAGKIVAVSDPYEGFSKSIIEPDQLGVDIGALAAKVSEAFDRHIPPDDFKLLLFSHFH